MQVSRRELLMMAASSALSFAGSARSLNGTPANVISVADFGALPDGSDAGPGVLTAINSLPRQGGAVLHFPAGTYRFSQKGGIALALRGVDDLTVEGAGATLLFDDAAQPISLQQCDTPTLRGFTIDWARPPFSQGEVIRVGADRRSADIRIDAEFPVTGTETVETLATYDRDSGLMATNGVDAYDIADGVSLAESQVLRIRFKRPLPLAPGHTAVLRHKVYGVVGIAIHNCSNVRLEDLRIHATPGMAIVGGGVRNVAINRVHVVPTPKTSRLMSTCADGIHLASCTGRVEIRDCLLRGMGDDGVNIHGAYLRVVRRLDARTLLLSEPGGSVIRSEELPAPGDVLELDKATSLEYLAKAKAGAVTTAPGQMLHVVSGLPAALQPGDLLIDTTRQPTVLIADCRFPGNRARGVLAHSDVTIQGCSFANQFAEAILLLPDSSALEGPAAARVSVRHNIISGALRGGYKTGAIRIGVKVQVAGEPPHPGCAPINHDIDVTTNEILDSRGAAIDASAVSRLTIETNQLTRPSGPAIVLSHVAGAFITNNTCDPPSPMIIEKSARIRRRANHGLVAS
jgi:hypothetical protein